jgi:hypothetical protein
MAATSRLITGVDCIPLSTRDIGAACEFYGTTLGLPRSVFVPERNHAEFETGNVTISVVDAPISPTPSGRHTEGLPSPSSTR